MKKVNLTNKNYILFNSGVILKEDIVSDNEEFKSIKSLINKKTPKEIAKKYFDVWKINHPTQQITTKFLSDFSKQWDKYSNDKILGSEIYNELKKFYFKYSDDRETVDPKFIEAAKKYIKTVGVENAIKFINIAKKKL